TKGERHERHQHIWTRIPSREPGDRRGRRHVRVRDGWGDRGGARRRSDCLRRMAGGADRGAGQDGQEDRRVVRGTTWGAGRYRDRGDGQTTGGGPLRGEVPRRELRLLRDRGARARG